MRDEVVVHARVVDQQLTVVGYRPAIAFSAGAPEHPLRQFGRYLCDMLQWQQPVHRHLCFEDCRMGHPHRCSHCAFGRQAAFAGLLLLASGIACGQAAPATAPTPLAQAQKLLAEEKYTEAASQLELLVKEKPELAGAWLALGSARRGLGQIAAAADAYRKALEKPALARPARIALFRLYAGADRPDDAYAWFEEIRASSIDLTQLAGNPEVPKLHDDARFAELFPDRIAFDRPFVEDTKIIHEWRGEAVGDEFGWIARGIGGADGDGATEVVVSATGNPPFGAGAGQVYVY
ncbi:MAG: hypothetical protein ABI588_05825, partial [Arenimonas sp.]